MIRFEILLRLFYNDGRPIEREKFVQTDDELVHLFVQSARMLLLFGDSGSIRARSIRISSFAAVSTSTIARRIGNPCAT